MDGVISEIVFYIRRVDKTNVCTRRKPQALQELDSISTSNMKRNH